MAVVPVTMSEAARQVTGLDRRAAIRCLRFVSQAVATHQDPVGARARFEQLVGATELSDRLREQLMDLSYD